MSQSLKITYHSHFCTLYYAMTSLFFILVVLYIYNVALLPVFFKRFCSIFTIRPFEQQKKIIEQCIIVLLYNISIINV